MAYTRANAVKFAEDHWNIPADDGLFWLSNQGVVVARVREANTIGTSFWKRAPSADGWMPFFVDDGGGGEKAVFVDSAKKEVWAIDNPESVKEAWGKHVALTVTEDASAKSVHVTSVSVLGD